MITAILVAGVLGQGSWCWVPGTSDQLFCDYSSYSTCMANNRKKEDGTCVPRPRKE
jgi:hypothetical protein